MFTCGSDPRTTAAIQPQPSANVTSPCEVVGFTGAGGGTEGALHPPALPVQAAAVHEGDLGSQQRTLTHQVCRDVLPAHRQVLHCGTDETHRAAPVSPAQTTDPGLAPDSF